MKNLEQTFEVCYLFYTPATNPTIQGIYHGWLIIDLKFIKGTSFPAKASRTFPQYSQQKSMPLNKVEITILSDTDIKRVPQKILWKNLKKLYKLGKYNKVSVALDSRKLKWNKK